MSIRPSASNAPGRILVIDDSEMMLDRIGLSLTAAGFEAVTTSQTVGAARHLRHCELVIVDYHMPGLNGVTVLESLRSAAVSANATCMFLLYTSDEETSKRYRELGFDGVLTKKGNMPELIRQLGAHLRIVRLRVLTARR